MTPRLIALALLAATACAKTDTATQTPEPTAEATPEATPEPAAEEAKAEPAEATPAPTPEPAAKDLFAVVEGLEKGKTFAELLVASELDKELHSSDVSITVLVPTDEAFAKLPKGTVDKWKKNKDQLQKILKYHFIPGVNNAAKIGTFREAPTASGGQIPIKTTQDSDMTVGGGRLTEIDLPASNGMVHMIDKVLQAGKSK